MLKNISFIISPKIPVHITCSIRVLPATPRLNRANALSIHSVIFSNLRKRPPPQFASQSLPSTSHFPLSPPPTAMPQSHPLLPLALLLLTILIFAAIAFAIYSIGSQVAETTSQKMERRNVSFSKSGMKVGVKHKGVEAEGDRVQRYVVGVSISKRYEAAGLEDSDLI